MYLLTASALIYPANTDVWLGQGQCNANGGWIYRVVAALTRANDT